MKVSNTPPSYPAYLVYPEGGGEPVSLQKSGNGTLRLFLWGNFLKRLQWTNTLVIGQFVVFFKPTTP